MFGCTALVCPVGLTPEGSGDVVCAVLRVRLVCSWLSMVRVLGLSPGSADGAFVGAVVFIVVGVGRVLCSCMSCVWALLVRSSVRCVRLVVIEVLQMVRASWRSRCITIVRVMAFRLLCVVSVSSTVVLETVIAFVPRGCMACLRARVECDSVLVVVVRLLGALLAVPDYVVRVFVARSVIAV